MNVGGIRKIAVYDPVLGTTVQLNNIGVEGDFKSEPMSVETAKGTKSYAGDNFSYNFVSYDESGYDQLKSWMDNQTPVNCVALGIDTHLLWAEDTLITVDMDYKFKVGELNGFSVKLEKKGGELNIFSGVNILKARYGFKDSNADGIADGYSIDAQDAIKSFWGNLQVIEGVETLTVEVYTSVIFPIAGAKLRLHVPSGASLLSWPTKIIAKLLPEPYSLACKLMLMKMRILQLRQVHIVLLQK